MPAPNACAECAHVWTPRLRLVSARCPFCGSRAVYAVGGNTSPKVPAWLVWMAYSMLTIGALTAFVAFGGDCGGGS
jgi:hypothetical protein